MIDFLKSYNNRKIYLCEVILLITKQHDILYNIIKCHFNES
ncbi:hypothetical protein SBF1_430017 [Candidatus Desulfosporosinus infrequens]|uniref:Uncharacterized protein n=1 Tax=Candidatus Desulfosporosinus infrequens TaxID=2043169 RepID=A0A2U3LB79_9FIRM|nr:hypothetical protein SBF1_430017 [Candidatus Desulfosporosinus infrequens]